MLISNFFGQVSEFFNIPKNFKGFMSLLKLLTEKVLTSFLHYPAITEIQVI